ncbi:MAG: SapC family protein [Luminiphilus sp.]|nr:SapC family protein [Luminiphilus sp.]
MSDFQILNNIDHKDLRITDTAGAPLGDAIHNCPAYTFEFRDLQGDFPILLQNTDQDGLIPVALMGFEAGENLFLDGDGWQALSRPAFLRKGPFLIGQHQTEDGEEVRLLSVDMSHPRVSEDQTGEAVFQPLGGRTEYLERVADLLEQIHEGADHTRRFTTALNDLDLVESVTMDITLRDGSKNQLMGFFALNEDRVRDLSGEALAELSARGFLMPLFMMLASLSNMGRLIQRKEQGQGAGP